MADDTTALPINDTGTHVHVYHPETGAHWDSPIGYLSVARQLGWEPAERPDDGVPINAIADAEPSEAALYDPSDDDAAGVSAHLAAHAQTNPGEVERVLDLERQGKNRKSITVPEGFDPIVKEN